MDSLSGVLKSAAAGGLGAFGEILARGSQPTQPVDTRAVQEKSKWDWRMVGLIGVVVVGVVLLMRFRK